MSTSFCSRFDHFGRLHDVQTLAMLACVFQLHCLHYEQRHSNTTTTNNSNSSVHMNGGPPSRSPGPLGPGGPSPPKKVQGFFQNHTNGRGLEGDPEFQEKEDRQEEMSSHEKNCRCMCSSF